MRHIEQSNEPVRQCKILRFQPKTPVSIIKKIEREYSEYLDGGDNGLVDITTTDWYRKMEKQMTPGKMLKTLREVRNLTQDGLGIKIGTPASRISDYETGQRAISKHAAKRIGDVFKVSPALFI
jgi:DNA-binding transcriptional regulator YiaG